MRFGLMTNCRLGCVAFVCSVRATVVGLFKQSCHQVLASKPMLARLKQWPHQCYSRVVHGVHAGLHGVHIGLDGRLLGVQSFASEVECKERLVGPVFLLSSPAV